MRKKDAIIKTLIPETLTKLLEKMALIVSELEEKKLIWKTIYLYW